MIERASWDMAGGGRQVADVNENLLLAVLAVLTDSVPRDRLLDVLSRWADEPDQRLGPILVAQGLLDQTRLDTLEGMLSEHFKCTNGHLGSSLAAWKAQALTEDMLNAADDPGNGDKETTPASATIPADLAATLPMVQDAGAGTLSISPALDPSLFPLEGSARSELPRLTQDERFQLLRQHARGGIGQVWVARDRELQREVAVKEIQPKYAERADQRARFLLEAEITGNLEHPGIVPVYSLGRNQAGRPFYAMRFIRGESLSVAIKRFHLAITTAEAASTGRRSGSIWGVEFQQLLRRFLDVCDALDYAHNRGVIHRDLKPANIMLGPFGETLVVDWGLAKVVGRKDIVSEQAEGDFESAMVGASVTASGETVPGTLIGTPAYMSPEQARGDIEHVGPTSDIYSLGATLYEILTGRAPFRGEKQLEVVSQVKEGRLVPPRSVLRSVPPALEAICLKAMALEHENRYQSVRDLSLELEHWLADEPVSAYPERPIQKLGRWLRQHRTLTYAAATALMGISLVATIAAVVVNGAREREAAFHKEAEKNFKEAEKNFAKAQKAVDQYLTSISEDTLLNEQDRADLRPLRDRLLNTALAYYQSFVQERGDDPGLRKELANAYYRVGLITREIGSEQKALDNLGQALKLWSTLLKESPDDPDVQFGLAQCLIAMGKVKKASDYEGARQLLDRAVRLLEPLSVKNPGSQRYRNSLAQCYQYLGDALAHTGDSSRAIEALETARGIDNRLIESDKENMSYRCDLAEVVNIIGFVYCVNEQAYDKAIKAYEEVKRACESILQKDERRPLRYRHLLALSEFNIGVSHYRSGKPNEAIAPYKASIEGWTELNRSHPSVTLYQDYLAQSNRELAQALSDIGKMDDAFAFLKESASRYERLCTDRPEVVEFQVHLAYTWNSIGVIHDSAKRHDLAREYFKKAVAKQREAIKISNGVAGYASNLSMYLENLGEQDVDQGKVSAGLPHYIEALEIRRQLHADNPDERDYATNLAELLNTLGGILRHNGDLEQALGFFEESTDLLAKQLSKNPQDPEYVAETAWSHSLRAKTLIDLKRANEAIPLLEESASLLRSVPLPEPGPTQDTRTRGKLSEVLWLMRTAFAASGRPSADVTRVDADIRKLWEGWPSSALVNLARQQAELASVIAFGQAPANPPAQSVRRADKESIAATLRMAGRLGLKDVDLARLESDPAFGSFFSPGELSSVPSKP